MNAKVWMSNLAVGSATALTLFAGAPALRSPSSRGSNELKSQPGIACQSLETRDQIIGGAN